MVVHPIAITVVLFQPPNPQSSLQRPVIRRSFQSFLSPFRSAKSVMDWVNEGFCEGELERGLGEMVRGEEIENAEGIGPEIACP
jgi:hypothetical protein